jgi:hypothetical protein
MQTLIKLLRPLWNPAAWFMIVLGSILFMARIQFSEDGWINLPELATLIELVGGLFIITGFQIMVSMLFWPDTNVQALLGWVQRGNQAAALVILGIKVFNGLSVIGFAIWLALSLNGGLR